VIRIEHLSVGGYVHDGVETHPILLTAGIWLFEGLNLSAVKPGNYELVGLPLRVAGADGAPARAILRRAVVKTIIASFRCRFIFGQHTDKGDKSC
jgi:arylformamidase